jgi:ubiquinone/menaquinone biosynthesis C-methylase UbiE
MAHSMEKQTNEEQPEKNEMEGMVASYDSYMRNITLGREPLLRETTVKTARVKPGDTVLEVGCGTGSLSLAAKRQAGPTGKVFGIDPLPGMIEVSKMKADKANEEINFQLGSIDNIPFPQDQFDVVLCSFMIFHISAATRKKGIAEIHRVLKPNGRLFVLDLALPTQPIQRAIAKTLLGFMVEQELEELIPLMKESGYSGIEKVPVDFRILGLSLAAGMTGLAQKGK